MASTTKEVPMFTRHFSNIKKMYLCESWCSYMGRSLPCEAFLKNMHGDTWEVKVANYQNTDKFWFEEGWNTFVEENKLAENDRIGFKFDGESTFYFMLFDQNGAEKECVRRPKSEQELQGMQVELASGEEEANDQADTAVGRERARTIRKMDEEAIFRAGFPRPNNPCFATKRKSHTNMLMVPKRLWGEFPVTYPEDIGITDERGNVWAGKVRRWREKRVWISKAWKIFCNWNQVKENDWCIVEIVRPATPGAQISLRTHLVPESTLSAAGII